MMRISIIARLPLFVLLCFHVASVTAKDEVRSSAVKVHVTQRPPDFMRPWTKSTARKTSGSGAIIEGNRILTNWHVVEYASQIFVQFDQTSDKTPARVVGAAPEMDLALLELEDPAELDGRPFLPIADSLPDVSSTVNVYGYPIGGEDMSVTEGIISRIDFTRYSNDAVGVRIQVDAALNPGNSGGPAVTDGQIVGLVFSKINQAENIGYLIPAEEIRMFLADYADGTYDGKPALYDRFQTAENVSLRAKLGLSEDTTGYVVREPFRDEESYPLKKWDVITHIGEHELDNLGNVRIRDDLRLDFRYLVPELAHNDELQLTIFRDGESLPLTVPVVNNRIRLLPSLKGDYPRHFIYGPLVFTAATQEFVRVLGARGVGYLAAVKSPLLYRQQDDPAFEGEELVVMANRMFSHRMIKGYRNMPFGVVSHVNGQSINNLRHFVELLRDCEDEFVVFEFADEGETLVFRRQELTDATEGILIDEGIRDQYSKDLADVWEGS
jgi:S1-C subfamily serine protease